MGASQVFSGVVGDTDYRIVALGDYDGDGRSDLLWHHEVTGDVWMWLMNGGTPASVTRLGSVADTGYQVVTPK